MASALSLLTGPVACIDPSPAVAPDAVGAEQRGQMPSAPTSSPRFRALLLCFSPSRLLAYRFWPTQKMRRNWKMVPIGVAE
jgi:hypothetical protein